MCNKCKIVYVTRASIYSQFTVAFYLLLRIISHTHNCKFILYRKHYEIIKLYFFLTSRKAYLSLKYTEM